MKQTIIARSREDLFDLIREEIELHGEQCDLNHIDISKVNDMSYIFYDTKFNGDISKWNVSHVTNMDGLFSYCSFNGDISKWNVSHVVIMKGLFSHSKFNGDISKWNVSRVNNMNYMFQCSCFNGDISNWKPYSLTQKNKMFSLTEMSIPYWAKYDDNESLRKAIDIYSLNRELNFELDNMNLLAKKLKI